MQAHPFLSPMTSLFALLSAKCVYIQDSEVIHYGNMNASTSASHAVQCVQCYTLRAPLSTTVLWPADYVELDVPPYSSTTHRHPNTQTYQTYFHLAWAPNPGSCPHQKEPKLIGHHKHLSKILSTGETSSPSPTPSHPSVWQPIKPKNSLPFSTSMWTEPDNILPEDLRIRLWQLLQTYIW